MSNIPEIRQDVLEGVLEKKEEEMQKAIEETDWNEIEVVDVVFVNDSGDWAVHDQHAISFCVDVHRYDAPVSFDTSTYQSNYRYHPVETYRFTEEMLVEAGIDTESGEYEQ